MSDSLSDMVYTHDDELRYQEIVGQIHWKRAQTRRKSILGAAEIFRILKTKKHEYDCYGNSLINFLYGAEVVQIMKTLNVSYVEDTEEVFKDKLKKGLAYASHKRDEFIETLNKRKSDLINMEPKDLIAEVIEDIKASEELIQTRYSSFVTYFQTILHQHRDIAAIVEVSEELITIKSRISTVMDGLGEKRKLISYIDFDAVVGFFSNDIDHAIEILNCQADSLSENILDNIEETNNLMTTLFNQDGHRVDKAGDVEDKTERSSKGDTRRKDVDKGGSEDGSDDGSDNGSDDGIKDDSKDGGKGYDKDDDEKEEQESTSSESSTKVTASKSGTKNESGEGNIGYIMAAVGKPLIQSLTNCALRHPANPICFVSGFMRNYRIKEEKAERKSEELRLLLAERQKIQLRKQARQQEEELRKRMEEALLLTMQPEGEE